MLVEDGALTCNGRIADYLPDFARNGKGDITLLQVLTHQGGFPGAGMTLPPAAWEDHQLLHRLVCDFTLEWTPGSRVEYHRPAAHWVAAGAFAGGSPIGYRPLTRSRLTETPRLSDRPLLLL